jgi:hypothetical protein
MSTAPPVSGPLVEPLRTHARADTWFRLRSPHDLPVQLRELAQREFELAAEGLWVSPGPALDAGVLYAQCAVEKVRVLVRLLRGGLGKSTRRELGGTLDELRVDLAGVRDVGTLEEVVERLRQSTHESALRDALMVLGGRLTERRYRESAERRNGEELGLVRTRVEALQAELADLEIDGDGFDLLAAGIRRVHLRAARELRRIQNGKRSARRHRRLMERVRDFSYVLRLVEPSWSVPLGALGHEADRVTGRLREADHLAHLRRRLGDEVDLAANLPSDELSERLGRLRDRFRTEAIQVARRIFADESRVFRARMGAWWAVWQEESGAAGET